MDDVCDQCEVCRERPAVLRQRIVAVVGLGLPREDIHPWHERRMLVCERCHSYMVWRGEQHKQMFLISVERLTPGQPQPGQCLES